MPTKKESLLSMTMTDYLNDSQTVIENAATIMKEDKQAGAQLLQRVLANHMKLLGKLTHNSLIPLEK